MSLNLSDIDNRRVGFFRFKELRGRYLITGDAGQYCFLEPRQFDLFLAGKIKQTYPDKYGELQGKGFIRDMLDFDGLAKKYASKNAFLGNGPSLHIVVVTLRCDHKCIYCQTSSKSLKTRGLDMDISTAQKVVDMIFMSPSEGITIEFQGGEPLINLDTVKFIVQYAKKKNKTEKKELRFALVSNLTFMTEDILKYLAENDISVCTSLDGPENVHNKQRIAGPGVNSYSNTVKWLKRLRQEIYKHSGYKVNALTTITKHSLNYPKEIVDEFVKLGLESIHLRPVSLLGENRKKRQQINFSPETFFNFYRKALDYIIELNREGKNFNERMAGIFLTKILTGIDPNYLDMRSPCGAGIGQLAYNFNGDVYTCDEARMLSMMGDESFRLGNVVENCYEEIIDNNIIKTLCSASCLDNLPGCSQCVYKPYCGVCPIYNYTEKQDIFTQPKNSLLCNIYTPILDYLFERLQDEHDDTKGIFDSWVRNGQE